VEVVTRDKKTHFQRVFDEGSRFHLLGWASETGDAGDAIEFLAHSPTEGRLGRLNTTGLRDATVDRLLREADDASDIADRSLRLQAAMARIAELRALLPLVIQAEAVAHGSAIDWEPPLSMTLHPAALRRAPGPRWP
jgi:hypothetical protein